MQKALKFLVTFGAVMCVTVLLTVLPLLSQGHTSEEMTKAAWEPFNNNNHKSAVEKAQECIYEFEGAAKRQQADLVRNKEPLPPTGKVDPNVKRQILDRGVLNDVGTCLWIKGRSAEYLFQKSKEKDTSSRDLAIAAYQEACGLTYARTWDPKGWFWSPAEAASDGLARLHSQCP